MSSFGTEFKINIHVEPIDGLHMDDYDFSCRFYVYTNRVVRIEKKDMIQVDQDNYIACVDSSKLGIGAVMMRITAFIPDVDFPDRLRTEVETVSTGITIG
jgi:hypothetical protein